MFAKPWSPTMSLRYALSGQLQQAWHRRVTEYSSHWKRTVYRDEYEWRDIPTEQPSQTTSAESTPGEQDG